MSRMSKKVQNYTSGKGDCNTTMGIFDEIQEVLNTMFDIRCSMKKKWGYEWYDYARYGRYEKAYDLLITKPACMAKSVALKCVEDLQRLNAIMNELEKEMTNAR